MTCMINPQKYDYFQTKEHNGNEVNYTWMLKYTYIIHIKFYINPSNQFKRKTKNENHKI